jgi:uncharacterized protein with HEPN domain
LSRGDELRLNDILQAIARIRSYAPAEDEPLVGATRDAILYNLVVIGEAAARLSDDLRDEASGVPWSRVVGLRNLLAHEYFRIDTAIVHEIVATQLAELEAAVVGLLERLDRPSS